MSNSPIHPELQQVTVDPPAAAEALEAPAALVTVIICVYNASEHLRPSLQSILDQTYSNLEIIIVDDGSTDDSIETIVDIEDRRVRVLREPHKGKAAALNVALEVMAGSYYAVQDADDISHPERIERQLRCFQENLDVAVVQCNHDLIIGKRHVAPRLRARGREECALMVRELKMPALDPTAMYRIEVVSEFKYEDSLLVGQGYDYLLRVGEQFPMVVLGEALYSYRVHVESQTRASQSRRDHYVTRVHAMAADRRGTLPYSARAASGSSHGPQAEDNNLAAHFIESAIDHVRAGKRVKAIGIGLTCVILTPYHLHYWKALTHALMPVSLSRRVRIERTRNDWAWAQKNLGIAPVPMSGSEDSRYTPWLREELLELIPANTRCVISAGCGGGATEACLVKSGIRVIGIESDPKAARIAESAGLEMVEGTVEEALIPCDAGSVDVLIYADVLEHLVDPVQVLRRHMEFLREEGTVIISIPNYRYYGVLWQLVVRGHVRHTDSGVLDKTHLKMATRRMAESWLDEVGCRVSSLSYKSGPRRLGVLSWLTLGLLKEFLSTQVVLTAQRVNQTPQSAPLSTD